MVGGVLTIGTVLYAAHVETALLNLDDYAYRAARVVWPLLLATPSLLGARLLVSRKTSASGLRPGASPNLLVTLLAAIVLPAVHTEQVIRQQTTLAETRRIQGQTLRAWYIVDRLTSMGSQWTVSGRTPAQQRTQWGQELERANVSLHNPLAANANVDTRLRRARDLIAWAAGNEDLDRATEVLAPIADYEPRALLLQTAVHGSREDWLAVSDGCQSVATLLSDSSAAGDFVNQLVERAYQRWAEALRRLGHYGAAQAVLEEGLAKWPGSSGYFHFQLAHHHDIGGRPRQAIEHYRQAGQTNVDFACRSERAIARLRTNSPASLLRTVRPATR